MWSWRVLCTDDDNFDELNEMYGSDVGMDGKRLGGIQEADVVWIIAGLPPRGPVTVGKKMWPILETKEGRTTQLDYIVEPRGKHQVDGRS